MILIKLLVSFCRPGLENLFSFLVSFRDDELFAEVGFDDPGSQNLSLGVKKGPEHAAIPGFTHQVRSAGGAGVLPFNDGL